MSTFQYSPVGRRAPQLIGFLDVGSQVKRAFLAGTSVEVLR